MLLHIFHVRVGKVWHRTGKVFTDPQFDTVMDTVGWYMPFGMRAYHYHALEPCLPFLPVWHRQPVIGLDVEALFTSACLQNEYLLQDERTGQPAKLSHRTGDHLLVQHRDGYSRYERFDTEFQRINGRYEAYPLSFKKAAEFTNNHHRHNVAPQGHKFSIGLMLGREMVGCAICSVPKSRHRDDGKTLEINRVTALPGFHNTCSQLIGRCVRCGREMGYTRFITYTLPEESGASIRASGFLPVGKTREAVNGWDAPSRRRSMPERYPVGEKLIWMRSA